LQQGGRWRAEQAVQGRGDADHQGEGGSEQGSPLAQDTERQQGGQRPENQAVGEQAVGGGEVHGVFASSQASLKTRCLMRCRRQV
jgi:hypothetical protein